MSRFEEVETVGVSPGPHLTLNEYSFFNKRATEEVLGDAESVTPMYDPDSDELAFRLYEGSGGLRSLTDHQPGKSIAMREVLQSPQISIDIDQIESGIRCPILYDGEEGVPYIRLEPVREEIAEDEQSSQSAPTGEDNPRGERV